MSKRSRRAMLLTQQALEHHAKALAPIKLMLQDALDFGGVMHRWVSSKGGNNSWHIDLPDGRIFDLRGRTGPPHINIKLRGSKKEWNLRTGRDAVRWVEAL